MLYFLLRGLLRLPSTLPLPSPILLSSSFVSDDPTEAMAKLGGALALTFILVCICVFVCPSYLRLSVGCPVAIQLSICHSRFWTVFWQSFGRVSAHAQFHGRHSVAARTRLCPVDSLFGRHLADCLIADCPSVLFLLSDHLSAVAQPLLCGRCPGVSRPFLSG